MAIAMVMERDLLSLDMVMDMVMLQVMTTESKAFMAIMVMGKDLLILDMVDTMVKHMYMKTGFMERPAVTEVMDMVKDLQVMAVITDKHMCMKIGFMGLVAIMAKDLLILVMVTLPVMTTESKASMVTTMDMVKDLLFQVMAMHIFMREVCMVLMVTMEGMAMEKDLHSQRKKSTKGIMMVAITLVIITL